MPNNFFVYYVESPSPQDFMDGRHEGNTLCSFLRLCNIPFAYNLAADRQHLQIALTSQLENAWVNFRCGAIVHFSLHGNDEGVKLTCGDFISWGELADLLRPIRELQQFLIVCLSSCEGATAKKMCRVLNSQDIPVDFLVASKQEICWPNAALAFSAFYLNYSRSRVSEELFKSIQLSCDIDDFDIISGKAEHHTFQRDILRNLLLKLGVKFSGDSN